MRLPVTAVLVTREDEWPADIPIRDLFDEVILETRSPGVHRRFELGLTARNDVLYVQDDDARIDVQALWRCYDGRLTHAITEGHRRIYEGTGVTLIGWGCFFPKSLVRFDEWRQKFGELDLRELDRIFTFFSRPHNTVVMPITMYQRAQVMSREPGHYERRDAIIRKLNSLEERCEATR